MWVKKSLSEQVPNLWEASEDLEPSTPVSVPVKNKGQSIEEATKDSPSPQREAAELSEYQTAPVKLSTVTETPNQIAEEALVKEKDRSHQSQLDTENQKTHADSFNLHELSGFHDSRIVKEGEQLGLANIDEMSLILPSQSRSSMSCIKLMLSPLDVSESSILRSESLKKLEVVSVYINNKLLSFKALRGQSRALQRSLQSDTEPKATVSAPTRTTT